MYSEFLVDAKALIEVVKLGSITSLSERDGEHRRTITRRISRIEEHFSSKLILTNRGRIKLTNDGEAFFINLRNTMNNIDKEINTLTYKCDKSKNHIKFLNSTDIYTSFGAQIHIDLLKKIPLLTMESKTYTLDQSINFGIILKEQHEDTDIIVLRENFLYLIDDQKWVLNKRFTTAKKIYASKQYIEKNPNIEDISDVDKHSCIINNYEKSAKKYRVNINPCAKVDTFNHQLKFIENHSGIALLPESIVKSSKADI